MNPRILNSIIITFIIVWNSVINVAAEVNESQDEVTVGENRAAAQLLAIIEHYKQEDPVGIPNARIPDPMPVPDISKSLGLATLQMKNIMAYGLSKFRIKTVNLDLQKLKAYVVIQLDNMKMNGDYTLGSFFSNSKGPFKVILKNVYVKGNASLAVERDGLLKTDDIQIDISFSDMAMDFQNLGMLGSVFQGVINSAPNLVFDTIKPFMLGEAYKQMRTEIDANIAKSSGTFRFPNSISPLDMAIAEGRKQVRNMGYDPYTLRNYNYTMGLLTMQMENTWIMGISSFYRFGNMTVSVVNNVVSVHFQIGTQKITGATQWSVAIGNGMINRAGRSEFTVQHIKASIGMDQPLDTRKRPKIVDMQVDLGNIQVRSDGAGTLDYALEFGVNVLPNLLRYQIMDALENPLKSRIQEKLDQIDVEKAINQYLPYFEKMNVSPDQHFEL